MPTKLFELLLPSGASTEDFEKFVLNRMFPAVSVEGVDIDAVSHRLFKSQSDESLGARYLWLTFLDNRTDLDRRSNPPTPPNWQLTSASATAEEISNFLTAFGEPAVTVTTFLEVSPAEAAGSTSGQ